MTTHGKLRRSPTEEQKVLIKNAFSLFDSDSDGYLDYFELKAGLRALGFPVKKAEVLKILDTYDKTNHKFICFDDFYSVARDKVIRRDPVEEIHYAFRLFLHNDATSIGYRDLQRIVDMLGLDITSEEIEGMINEFDSDNDGRRSITGLRRNAAQKFVAEGMEATASLSYLYHCLARQAFEVAMSVWEDEARQTVLQGRASLERMADSLANSHRVAVETEELGATVAAELGEQRESLLRSKHRLEDTEQALHQSRSVMRRMTLHVLTNKIILIIIILLEMGILGATIYLKHFRK